MAINGSIYLVFNMYYFYKFLEGKNYFMLNMKLQLQKIAPFNIKLAKKEISQFYQNNFKTFFMSFILMCCIYEPGKKYIILKNKKMEIPSHQ